MVSILGMASNRGRNLINIHRNRPGGAELAAVVSNDASAPILEKAEARDIPAIAVERGDNEGRFAHEERLLEAIEVDAFDLVCLDGYMRILSSTFLEAMPTTLNIHPSLLPAFPGDDAWGDALEAGVSVTGCTVHVVTDAVDEDGNVIEEEVDAGPIVTQEPIPVYPEDARESLKERVLYEGEFKAYPRAVRAFAEDRVEIAADGSVTIADEAGGRFPSRHVGTADRLGALRYGENPHQEGAVYVDATATEPNVIAGEQLAGKGMSYVNYIDAAGALKLVLEFSEPAAAVIKHANPAGCATAEELVTAYDRALSTDPMSAFGGIVALNRPCDPATAERIVDSVKHVVVAPGYREGALEILREREDMRVIDAVDGEPRPIGPDDRSETIVERAVPGGRLLQDRDLFTLDPDDLEVVTERAPTDEQRETMRFAWPVVKHATSNAIVLATGTETVGLGIGQVSRVDAVRLAARKAEQHAEGKHATGAVMASDAFFPFPDGIEAAAEAGIDAIVQPGGSTRDEDVIAAAEAHGMTMAFTGHRAFRHE